VVFLFQLTNNDFNIKVFGIQFIKTKIVLCEDCEEYLKILFSNIYKKDQNP
jgi:hypothetical protein